MPYFLPFLHDVWYNVIKSVKGCDVMSVIMAYKTYDKLYLGADNRAVDVDETTYRDNKSKILLINDNIAIAFAGCNNIY